MKPTDHRVGWPTGRRALTIILAACLLTSIAMPSAWVSAASPSVPEPLSTQPNGITVDTGPLSVASDASFRIGVNVAVPEPMSYLEVRLQIRRPSGRLLFQRTEIRTEVETGTVDVEFSRELTDLELRPDAYPYEIRVRSQTDEVREKTATGYLLVHAPEPAVTPVALAVRISSIPRFDAQGHFVNDPARSTIALEQAETLARTVLEDRALRLTLAIAPVTLDEWARISQGYLLSEAEEGLVDVPAGEPGPVRYASALAALREAVATGRLELLDVPYADPDIAALAASDRLGDLIAHYSHGLSTYLATLETSPSAGTAVAADVLPAPAFGVLEERKIRFALLAPETPDADVEDVSGGSYSIEGSSVRALVLDREICDALEQGATSAGALLAFRRAVSEDAAMPIVTLTDLGPGPSNSVASVIELAALLEKAAWADLVTASEAAEKSTIDTLAAPSTLEETPTAPAGYWSEVAEARRYAAALEHAAGAGDPDARMATEASLIAQSARWAGPDRRWSMADRGRAFASSAERLSRSFLDQIAVTAKDVTLASPRGEVPISIVNGSDKDLEVVLKVRANGLQIAGSEEVIITLRPQENFHAVGVDLQSALAGALVVELWAGDVMLASGSSVVRASYLDRLAIVGGVTVLLLALLLYIRRRVRTADADKMPEEEERAPREDRGS
ncbi:MAG: hypothetical protein IBX63_08290 [Coriobacteriia bacterium]|nr:hypothetical protein [Coriobacteriia bacterium]